MKVHWHLCCILWHSPQGFSYKLYTKDFTLFQFCGKPIHWVSPITMLWASNYFHLLHGYCSACLSPKSRLLKIFFPIWAVIGLLVPGYKSIGSLVQLYISWRYGINCIPYENMFAQRHNDAFWLSLPAVLKLSGFWALLETKLKYSQYWVSVAISRLRTFS